MTKILIFFCLTLLVNAVNAQSFRINIAQSLGQTPLDGRLLLLLSTDASKEPRFQISDAANTQMVFGVDVNNWQPGEGQLLGVSAFGYPVERLQDIPAGDYYVQALLHKYETFHLKTGHTVKLPMDRGEGQHWNEAPGNIYSSPIKININTANSNEITLTINKTIPPIAEPADTKYIKHIKIQSKLLTEFWGRPMYLGAHVLLPHGFDEHPSVKYPLAIFHGHFPADFGGFRTTTPDANLVPDTNARFNITGYNKIQQQEEYDFYKQWTGPDFPRVLAIEIQHANPYYDDSYAVNSANLGPYGDAITYELIPEIEKRFRGIGQGWARFMYGGSTGGWEVLAAQVFYPKEYNGCYAACPDPVDFRHYTTVNIYDDKNAFYVESDFKKTERPGHRDYLGHVSATVKSMNRRELAIGTRSRSGDQFDIWEAVFSPMDTDGYPKRIYDKYTGAIDTAVARHWRENYDLTHIIKRDWPLIGDQLKGKIHLYVGDMDNYYLNNAVYSAEDMLKKLSNPACNCEVAYGDRAEHCWKVDPLAAKAPGWSPYRAFFCNPIRYTDPDGLWEWDATGNLVAQKGDNSYSMAKFLGTNQSNAMTLLNRGGVTANAKGVLNLKEGQSFAQSSLWVGTKSASGPVVNSSKEATAHYYNGNGAAVDVGDQATTQLLSSDKFQTKLTKITSEKVQATGDFNVDLTNSTFHIGRTNVDYSVTNNGTSSAVTFTLFSKDGFWDPNFVAEKSLGKYFDRYKPDQKGPNLETPGGTPYDYKTRERTFFFKPVEEKK